MWGRVLYSLDFNQESESSLAGTQPIALPFWDASREQYCTGRFMSHRNALARVTGSQSPPTRGATNGWLMSSECTRVVWAR